MSNRFTVRVELHGVHSDSEYYERLHDAMGQAGFKRSISFEGESETYALPTAEYRYRSDTETNQQVADKAYNIANRIKRDPSVISTRGPIAQRGLKEI